MKTEEELANLVVDELYPQETLPISVILGGSRAYGTNSSTSDYDYYGIHLASTGDLLEYPERRPNHQRIEAAYCINGTELVPCASLTSYEMWRFLDIIKKGGFVAYEILFLPEIHHIQGSDRLIEKMRLLLTSRIGPDAKGIFKRTWGRDRTDKKKTIMAYYRLHQAIYYLQEEIFEWQAEALFSGKSGEKLYRDYISGGDRLTPLDDLEVVIVTNDLTNLMDEVDRALISTHLLDKPNERVLLDLLRDLKKIRLSFI
jgi:hypothetical protein